MSCNLTALTWLISSQYLFTRFHLHLNSWSKESKEILLDFFSDIDECQLGFEVHHCEKWCRNIPGSYVCDCPQVFYLESDNKTCKGICLTVIPGILKIHILDGSS